MTHRHAYFLAIHENSMINWKKLYLKFFEKQWIIGICQIEIDKIILQKITDLKIHWVTPKNKNISLADPFVLKAKDGLPILIVETVSNTKLDGKISLVKLNKSFELVSNKIKLDCSPHLSYPFVYREADKIYFFPESARLGKLYCFEFDSSNYSFINRKLILDFPIIDASLLKYNNQYWIFGTIAGKNKNDQLHIYYSDSLFGPYLPHKKNLVKSSLYGSRPAGGFIQVGNEIFRPSQNCQNWYGESIIINKIHILNLEEYFESEYMHITPSLLGRDFLGTHTINHTGNIVVIDALRGYFSPLSQIKNSILRFCRRLRSYF